MNAEPCLGLGYRGCTFAAMPIKRITQGATCVQGVAFRGHLAMICQFLIISPAYSLARFATQSIETPALLQVRLIGSALFLVPLFYYLGGWHSFRLPRKKWPWVVALASIGIVGNQFLFMYGLKLTTPSNSSLLYALTPLVVLLLSAWVFRTERLTWLKALGILLAAAGVWVVFIGRDNGLAPNRNLGNLVTLTAMLCWSLYIALSKRVVEGLNSLQLTAVVMVIGGILFLPVGIPAVITFDWGSVPMIGWWGLACLILINSLANYLLIGYGVSLLRASQAAVYINLHPIGAAIASYFIIGEKLSDAFLLGGLLTLAGLYTVNFAQSLVARIQGKPRTLRDVPEAPAEVPPTPSVK